MSSQRLLREFKDLTKTYKKNGHNYVPGNDTPLANDTTEIILFPKSETNIFQWIGYIIGPPDSPYADYRFKLVINVPRQYPLVAPKIKFITKVCHPNVHFMTGEICLDVLKEKWTPVWTLESSLRAVIMLLGEPEASSPLNCDAGNLIRAGDWLGFNSLAKMYVIDCALKIERPEKKTNE